MPDEKDKTVINKKNEEILEKYKKKLTAQEKVWTLTIDSLSKRINCELKKSIDLSADAICQRQLIIDERTQFYFTYYKDMPKFKEAKKRYFEYYSGTYPFKTNGTEKQKLIDADIRWMEAKMDFSQNYINFLSESLKTVDHIIYSIKNKIELYNATGLD